MVTILARAVGAAAFAKRKSVEARVTAPELEAAQARNKEQRSKLPKMCHWNRVVRAGKTRKQNREEGDQISVRFTYDRNQTAPRQLLSTVRAATMVKEAINTFLLPYSATLRERKRKAKEDEPGGSNAQSMSNRFVAAVYGGSKDAVQQAARLDLNDLCRKLST
jgi:hypothetical protein